MSSETSETFSDAAHKFPVQGTVRSDEPRPNASTATEPRPVTDASDATAHPQVPVGETGAVDASVRLPVLLFFMSALGWIVLGSALALFAELKLNVPDLTVMEPSWSVGDYSTNGGDQFYVRWLYAVIGFFSHLLHEFFAFISWCLHPVLAVMTDAAWLTVGRVLPAAAAAMTYGWAASAGIGVGLWLLARLGRVPLRHGGVLVGAWLLWNLGVTLGVAAVLYGQGTSYHTLEFPRYVFPLLFSAWMFIGVYAVLLYRHRQGVETYVSQWYALAAFLWFPWMYATANLLVFFVPVQAPAKAIVAAWYAHSLLTTFFVPLALAVAYYIIPKVVGHPIHRYGWAKFGFWTWLLFASWAGTYDLIDGPIPAWLSSVAVVASLLTLLPLAAITTNLLGTMSHRYGGLRHSPSLRFVVVGVCCFVAATVASVLFGFRSVNEVVHFTLISVAGGHLLMYGFVSFALFGAVYYIVPRLLGTEWASSALIRSHFWYATVGLGLIVVSSLLGGLVQGLGLDDPKVPMIAVLSFVKPFLASNLVATLLMLVGHVCLIASFSLILVRIGYAATMRRPLVATGPAAPAAAAASNPLPASTVAAH